MRTQAADLAAGRKAQSTDDLDAIEEELEKGEAAVAAPEKRYGFLAVCAGEGLAAVFRDLTVDRIVSGGQTMNPSTEAILQEVNRTPSEVVFYPATIEGDQIMFLGKQPASKYRCIVIK